MKKIFFLTSGPIFPVCGARRIRDFQVLKSLTRYLPVEVHYLIRNPHEVTEGLELRNQLTSALGVEWHPHSMTSEHSLSSWLRGLYSHYHNTTSPTLEKALEYRLGSEDLLWLSRLRMAHFSSFAEVKGATNVLDAHQVESDLQLDSVLNRFSNWYRIGEALQNAWYERNVYEQIHWLASSSAIDVTRLRRWVPNHKIRLIPHSVDIPQYDRSLEERTPTPGLCTFIFIGDWDYHPNRDGLAWFHREIIQRLKLAMKTDGICIKILNPGSCYSKAPEWAELHLYRSIEELKHHVAGATAAVFPLKEGRGNRVQFIEAMALGLPIVTTGKAADGMNFSPSVDAFVSDDPDNFTSCLLKIARNPKVRSEMIENSRDTIQKSHAFSLMDQSIQNFLRETGFLNVKK